MRPRLLDQRRHGAVDRRDQVLTIRPARVGLERLEETKARLARSVTARLRTIHSTRKPSGAPTPYTLDSQRLGRPVRVGVRRAGFGRHAGRGGCAEALKPTALVVSARRTPSHEQGDEILSETRTAKATTTTIRRDDPKTPKPPRAQRVKREAPPPPPPPPGEERQHSARRSRRTARAREAQPNRRGPPRGDARVAGKRGRLPERRAHARGP